MHAFEPRRCVVLIFIAVGAVFAPAAYAETKYYAIGSGGNTQSPLYAEWTSTFNVLSPDTTIVYQGISQTDGKTRLLAHKIDFVGSDYNVFADADYANNPTLRLIPSFITNIGFCYSIPSLSRSLPNLVLSRQAASKIFRGAILNWNDPEILDLQNRWNPGFNWAALLPNSSINVGLRSDRAVTTTIVSAGLYAADPWWGANFNDTIQRNGVWPASIRALPNRQIISGNLGVMGLMSSVANSMSYLPLPYMAQFPEIRRFEMINVRGERVDGVDIKPLNQVVERMVENNLNVTIDTYRIVLPEIVDPDVPGAWPMSTFSYLVLDSNATLGNCANRTALLKYINWILTSQTAADVARRKSCLQVPASLARQELERIRSWTCSEPASNIAESAILYDTPYEQRNGGTTATFVVEMVLLCVSIGCIVVFLFLHKVASQMVNQLEMFYSSAFIVGAIISGIGIVMWFLVPTNDSICASRVWFTSLGLTCIVGSTFTRLYHLNKIVTSHRRNKLHAMRMDSSTVLKIAFLIISVVMLVQIVILVLWQSIWPLRAVVAYKDPIQLVTEHRCEGTATGAWLIVEIIFAGLNLFFSCYVIFIAWGIRGYASDTRGLLIATYNLILLICVLVPIFSITSFDELGVFYISTLSITFSVVGTTFLIYVRRLIATGREASSRTATTGSKSPATRSAGSKSAGSKSTTSAESSV